MARSMGHLRELRAWAVLALLCLATAQAYAAQVFGVQVTRDGARFLIQMHLVIDAPAPAVFLALRDYAAMPRYNSDLRAVRVEPTAEPNRVQLFAIIDTCVLFFCKAIHQEQVMTATSNASGGILQAELVSRGGDFKGQGRWTVKPCRSDRSPSCVDVGIELVPVFWMPPVIGPWLIRRKMSEEAQRSAAGLEQLAQASR
jgi:hypothetical protein